MKKIAVGLLTTLSLWGVDGVKIFGNIDTGLEAYKYEEKSVMNISGPMYRLDAGFGILISLLRLQVEGYYATDIGRNIYNGTLYVSNGSTHQKIPYKTKSTEWYAGGNLKIGLSILPQQMEARSFAYMGVGYRFLRNNVIDQPGVKGAYQRDQSYFYLPIGVDTEIPLTDRFSFTAMTEYRFLVFGRNTSKFTQINFDADLHFKQNSGLGGRVAIGTKFHYNSRIAIQASLYYDYWLIEKSDKQVAYKNGAKQQEFIEPQNSTNAIGFLLGMTF